jgi:uncharacterized protein (TIGR02145 family)
LANGGGSAFQAPYSGGYYGSSFYDQGSGGYYWSSTPYTVSYAYSLYFNSNGNLSTSNYAYRGYYLAVRCYRQ